MTTVDAAFTHGNKNYFFYSEWYYRYGHSSKTPDSGYPAKIKDYWHGMPENFHKDIDAVFKWTDEKVYFFKGDEYLRYNMVKDKVDKGYPKKIKGNWNGLWDRDIDAVVVWPRSKKVYFFKGGDVKRYDYKKDQTDYTKKIPQSWKGVWADGVDAALKWDGKKSYLFNQQQYIRYNNKKDHAETGYPKDIEAEWRFTERKAYKPIARKKGPKCGGENYKACGFAKAEYIDRARGRCPGGSFWDPIDGGSCYRCPSNYNRTLLWSVKSDKACQRAARESLRRASRKKSATFPWDCSKGQFWDVYKGGACWTCPKDYNRTAYHVASKKACVKSIGSQMASAAYKGGLPCPKGSFLDIGKGECWSCPSGYNRTVIAAVNEPKACLAKNQCASGNVAVGNPVSGYTCYKKGACGKRGQRPCLIVERVPSCDKGLAEDFIANKCIDTALAACLTGVRTLRYAIKAEKGLSTVEKEAMKVAQKGLDTLKKSVPGLNKALETAEKETNKLTHKAREMVNKSIHKLLPEAQAAMKKIGKSLEKIDKSLKRNKGKMEALLTSDAFCTMTGNDRERKITALLGSGLSEIKSAQADPDIWTKYAKSLFINEAHAAESSIFDPAGLMVGLSVEGQTQGGAIGPVFAYGWDFSGKSHKLYTGLKVTKTTDPTTRLNVSPFLKLIPKKPRIWDETSFISFQWVYNENDGDFVGKKRRGKFKVTTGISAIVHWNDPSHPISFGGISLFPFLAEKTSPKKFNKWAGQEVDDTVTEHVDISVSHVWKVHGF
ncbi:MAG: hypothetical protein ISR51_08125 [Rhodospirillales bacterium]|nr:hypothetical protein [Alphaproteobacteria bacterium]MBL6948629.1 hypothetical protein [Rhodospirillales bacterium]